MTLPWMRLYTRDWLDNKELRRCTPLARSVLIDLMCLASEGQPFGHLADRVGPLTVKYMASRCVVTNNQFLKAVAELTEHARLESTEDGVLLIPRMVEDEAIRQKKEECGRKGGNPKLRGVVNHEDNQSHNLISDSVSDSNIPSKNTVKSAHFSWEEINEAWKWFQQEYPGDVNEFDSQLFIGVMDKQDDLTLLRKNLPLWKQTRKWLDGYHFSAQNFLSKRMFRQTPKGVVPAAPEGTVYKDWNPMAV